MQLDWLNQPVESINQAFLDKALARQQVLTKPRGALGRLESLAVRLAGMQASERPAVDKVQIVVFAADHGVVEEGVSLFPQVVTAEMVRNFSRGGAAISVLAKSLGADLEVVNVGTVEALEALPGVLDQRVAPGTANFRRQPAMTESQLVEALAVGRRAAERAHEAGAQLFIGGEMGIGNTSAATAVSAVLLGRSAAEQSGPGTGLDTQGVDHKARVIESAIEAHGLSAQDPLAVLRHVGGLELAALTGAYLRAAQLGLPVLVDGFIATASALLACRLQPAAQAWLILAHHSAEPGYAALNQAFEQSPLLALDMRLGEGSGAAVALPLLRLACRLHNEMATFEEAGVSDEKA